MDIVARPPRRQRVKPLTLKNVVYPLFPPIRTPCTPQIVRFQPHRSRHPITVKAGRTRRRHTEVISVTASCRVSFRSRHCSCVVPLISVKRTSYADSAIYRHHIIYRPYKVSSPASPFAFHHPPHGRRQSMVIPVTSVASDPNRNGPKRSHSAISVPAQRHLLIWFNIPGRNVSEKQRFNWCGSNERQPDR